MSFDDGFILGLSLGGGGGKKGDDIYITAYSDTAISIKTIADRTAETPETTDHAFTFTLKEFKTVTTAKTSKGKSTRTWIKNIITSVANVEGAVIWALEPNDMGTIIAVYDVGGNEILSGITNGDSVITNTPEGVALGYALAYNKEQENYTEKLIEAYEDGVNDESTIGVDDEETVVDVTDLKGAGAVLYSYSKKSGSDEYYLEYIFYGEYGTLIYHSSDNYYHYNIVNVYRRIVYDSHGEITADQTFDPYSSFAGPDNDYNQYYGDWFYGDGTPVETDGITDV